MMYQLTNEQADELRIHMMHDGVPLGKLASEWLSANLPAPVPVLRPIQEMPPEVPEGCFRLFGGAYQKGWRANNSRTPADTHFIDVRIPEPPDPEAELRWEFEEWLVTKYPTGSKPRVCGGKYELAAHRYAWEAYKAGKEAQRG